jgi:hypothetical protein
MNDILNAVGPFAWGFVMGFFWYPIWAILKKIWSEAKLTREEWRQPRE